MKLKWKGWHKCHVSSGLSEWQIHNQWPFFWGRFLAFSKNLSYPVWLEKLYLSFGINPPIYLSLLPPGDIGFKILLTFFLTLEDLKLAYLVTFYSTIEAGASQPQLWLLHFRLYPSASGGNTSSFLKYLPWSSSHLAEMNGNHAIPHTNRRSPKESGLSFSLTTSTFVES